MTGDFVLDWFTLILAFTVGLAPYSTFWGTIRLVVGKEPPEGRDGCAFVIVAVALLLLIAAPFIGYWCFQTFAVVWRP